ncbi:MULTISPECIES: ketopantoate reductase family protein [unclassified Nonomuraea]|uniref:ketopantoate reductase family protein n=1 Tax=unclassified Nonomuraea TaxID=2593643 RepID=UPI0034112F5F
MRVGVIGSGATGGYLAAKLAHAGISVTLVARGESYARIEHEGIVVNDPDGTRIVARPEQLIKPGGVATPAVDLVLFCVKSYDTNEAAAALTAVAGDHARVLCLQNGVRNEEVLADLIGPARLLSGVLYIGARRTAPGVIDCTSPPRIHLGDYVGQPSPDLDSILDVFRSANLDIAADDRIRAQKWQKFLFNCALNPLTALIQRPLGDILARPSGRHLYGSLLEEAIAVGRAHGAPIPSDAGDKVWEQGNRMNILSSMAEDVAAGRPLEIDAFTGYVHELGDRHGVETPVSGVVLDMLKTLDPAAA